MPFPALSGTAHAYDILCFLYGFSKQRRQRELVMLEALKQFDTYSLKARVFPALIAGLPTLGLLVVIVPWDHIGLSHAISGAMVFVLLFAFADAARRTGKQVQSRLGTGTTPELWHRSNDEIPSGAKDRYRSYVAKQLDIPAPTEAEEVDFLNRSNDFYNTAGNWLRENTRDQKKFSILFAENITYGFRRNLLGLKPIALFFNTVILCFCITTLYFKFSYFMALQAIYEKLAVLIIAIVLHSAYMIFAVKASGVREASLTYGRQLILSCESLISKSSTPKKKGAF